MVYVLGSHTLRQRRHPAAAIAWVVSLVLLPYVALPLYLVFGTRKLVHPRADAARLAQSAAQQALPWPQQLALAMNLAPAASFHGFRLHEDGAAALAALHEVIDAARTSLDVCTYILGRDAVADALCEKLERKARAGVKVRLMVDGAGNLFAGRHDLDALRAAGVETVVFVPPPHSPRRGRFNLRNHRKAVIADGAWLWCGGRNLTAQYFEGALRLSRPGSLIVVDNVVRGGAVTDAAGDANVQGIRRMFEMIAAEPRVEATAVQTVGSKGWDGFCLIRVK